MPEIALKSNQGVFRFSVEFCEPRMTDYTMKPLGAGLVALRSMKDYK